MAGKLKLYIDVAADGAIRSLEKVETETQKVEKGFSGLGSVVSGSLVAGLAAGTAALGAMAFATSKAFDALDDAGRIQGLQRSFENLQSSIGVVADSSIQSLQDATSGLVSDLGLMEAANNAVLLGVDDGTGKFAEMAEAAVKLGQATGRTALEAIGDLTTGIGRQSKLILDNLGVVVDTTAAYDKYALSIGTTADKLDDNQKKLAFQAEAFAQVTAKAAELPDVLENGATAFQRLQAQTENVSNKFSVAVSENDKLKNALDSLSGVIDEVPIQELADLTADFAAVTLKLGKEALPVAKSAIEATSEAVKLAVDTIEDLSSTFEDVSGIITKVTPLLSGLARTTLPLVKAQIFLVTSAIDGLVSIADLGVNSLSKLGIDITSVGKNALSATESFNKSNEAMTKFAGTLDKLKDVEKGLFNEGFAPLEEFEKAEKAIREIEQALKDGAKPGKALREEFERLSRNVEDFKKLAGEDASFGEGYVKLTNEIKKTSDQLDRLGNPSGSASKAKEKLTELEKAQQKLNETLIELRPASEAYETAEIALRDYEQQLRDGLATQAEFEAEVAALGSNAGLTAREVVRLESQIGQLNSEVEQGSRVWDGFANSVGEGLASLATGGNFDLGGILDLGVGSIFADGLGESLSSGISDALSSSLNIDPASLGVVGDIGASFGASFVAQFAEETISGVQNVFSGDELSSTQEIALALPTFGASFFFNDIADAFGGNTDAEANAREGFQSFFREILDANELQLVIDDQFQKLDFNITGGRNAFDGGALFDTAFEGLDQNVISQFSSIGGALNDLIGTGEDLGSQFGAILADQLGGDLNNLQLLLQETGVSAEQMSDSVVNSFLSADISAIEAQSSLAAITDLFAAGIPGAVGATEQAFDNLVNGAGRGRQAIDALGDIGAEAIEGGLVKNLEELEASLVAQGKPLKEVDQLFNALEASGVSSLQELTDISDRAGISILANLEASSFGFEGSIDNATGKVEKLINDLENVPAEVRTKYIVDVEVRGDSIPEGAPGLG